MLIFDPVDIRDPKVSRSHSLVLVDEMTCHEATGTKRFGVSTDFL